MEIQCRLLIECCQSISARNRSGVRWRTNIPTCMLAAKEVLEKANLCDWTIEEVEQFILNAAANLINDLATIGELDKCSHIMVSGYNPL